VIVDSSALLAILKEEPEANEFSLLIEAAEQPRISAANYLESAIVFERSGPAGAAVFDAIVGSAALTVEPVTYEQALIARQAYRVFGKGSGHRARLNFGDCFAYALAVATDEPLLYKGDDFTHTNVKRAVKPA
jgi:ribonuclease VapC